MKLASETFYLIALILFIWCPFVMEAFTFMVLGILVSVCVATYFEREYKKQTFKNNYNDNRRN